MFSATWPKDVQELSKKHCKNDDPLFIRVGGDKLAACRTIAQTVLVLPAEDDKFVKLAEALTKSNVMTRGADAKCLVFCKTKKGVDDVAWQLSQRNVDVQSMHGDKSQDERTQALKDFKHGQCSLLVCTGILGRGHDIPRVKYIVNYDVPQKIEDYVHRIGRTGRAGEKGFALTFLTQNDYGIAPDLVQVLRQTDQPVTIALEELARGGAESDWSSWQATDWKGTEWQDNSGGVETNASPQA